MKTMERFCIKKSRSTIQDSNQIITFCGVGYHHQIFIVERKVQNQTLGTRTLRLHAKIYGPESMTTMFWPYELKAFAEQLNVLKVEDDGFIPMQNFSGTTTDINLKNHYIRGFLVYFLGAIIQGSISGLPKWGPCSLVGIYLGHSSLHTG